ncbi:MAG TPA: glycosyltransferase [Solirubrobacteraceae bacterium]|nr:glycosyltransferase [Solirubrobacteraceae bacterium]
MNELPKTRRVNQPTGICVIVATDVTGEPLRESLQSLHAHSVADVQVVEVAADSAAVNRALAACAPADAIVLDEPCRVSPGWVGRLAVAAHSETNIATASALADAGTPLGLSTADSDSGPGGAPEPAGRLAERTLSLLPRLNRAVAPCVYVRRDALELVGALDEQLDLRTAIELDLTQRCLLSGMTHVAADDVVVERLAPAPGAGEPGESPELRERYPYLEATPLADSAVLARALQEARGPSPRLAVTIDARALDGAITGTHVHIVELILALARTGALRLRVLVRSERIDRETRELLQGLAETELLAAEDLDPSTPRTAVFHRPQQTFAPSDVKIALALGERFVISQLDLIAYRNPGYFSDADAWQDYRAASRHGLSAAERVVVFSEHTREELVSDALVERDRVRVVAPGLDHRPSGEPGRPAGLNAAVEAGGEAVGQRFLLCLGTDFRHKNRVFALRLYNALRENHGWRGSLVFAGTHIAGGSSVELERAYLHEHPALQPAVVDLGPVSEREKAWLMDHAAAIVYPSVYEGFGLVPFESALSEVPCVFAPWASLAEAAPQQTATIVPWDAAVSAQATHALLTDADARKRHIAALATRARELTWDAAAASMVGIYREAALAPVRDSATLSRDLVKREARLSVQHDAEVRQLVSERQHAQRMYDELNAEVGSGLALIGPNGTLPDAIQRALLALTGRPALSGPLFAAVARVYGAARILARPIKGLRRRGP